MMTLPLEDIESKSPVGKRVLVVEDEPLIAYDLVSEIESGNHVVIGQCGVAAEAVALTGELKPDVVVMDIGLLGKQTGIDAAREIRKRFGIGCVFVSATLDRVDPDVWGDIQPLALIRKPYRDKALSRAIAQDDAA
ncbi:response regulator [uncultured Algimonas sp.]|uniref:response regulator n=1 Tax=uncultured Algimonas sp. TaxID=1547920 RepID=UPI0026362A8D|nr:response regulator [uncultured Algimonas sp.]